MLSLWSCGIWIFPPFLSSSLPFSVAGEGKGRESNRITSSVPALLLDFWQLPRVLNFLHDAEPAAFKLFHLFEILFPLLECPACPRSDNLIPILQRGNGSVWGPVIVCLRR